MQGVQGEDSLRNGQKKYKTIGILFRPFKGLSSSFRVCVFDCLGYFATP